MFTRILGQAVLILLAYNMHWAKEWFLLTLVPTTLIGIASHFTLFMNIVTTGTLFNSIFHGLSIFHRIHIIITILHYMKFCGWPYSV